MPPTQRALEVRPLAEGEEGDWDSFLSGRPGALVYHSSRYRDLIRDHLGCRAEYLVAEEGGEIRGVLPAMSAGERGAQIWNSLPFYGSHGSPIADSPEAGAALIEAWDERASDPSTLAATMIGNPFADPPSTLPDHDLTDERISQVTELPAAGGEPELMELIESSARRNVRKADRLGIEIARDETAVGELGRIHRENMEAIGGLAKSQDFFDALPRHLRPGEDFEIWVARLDGELIAALLVLRFNGVVEYFTPVTEHEHRASQPMALILIKAMAAAVERGERSWNWGGTWSAQDGVHRFKRKWGAGDGTYTYFTRLNDRSLLDSGPEELRARFPGFFVVPFSALHSNGRQS